MSWRRETQETKCEVSKRRNKNIKEIDKNTPT
jgi:hypothetical protein